MAESTSNIYMKFVKEIARISSTVPTAKPPKLLNAHLITHSPFPASPERLASQSLATFETRRRSNLYSASVRTESDAQLHLKMISQQLDQMSRTTSTSSSESTMESDLSPPSREQYLTNIPLPKVLLRHITSPSQPHIHETALGKVTGFRIVATGKRGTRSNKQVVQYGRLGTDDIANSCVDFGKSFYVNKKGTTGVRVWVGYSN